eukprot:9447_1
MAQSQSQTSPPKLSVKPTVSETSITLELLPIIDELDKYSNGTVIESDPFALIDVIFSIRLYPRGEEQVDSEDRDKIGIFLQIKNAKPNDHRKVYVSVANDEGLVCRPFVRSLHKFHADCSSFGWSHLTHSELKKNPNVYIRVKLTHDPLFIFETTGQTLENQHEHMHALSTYLGDITLVVELPEFTDDLSAPPKQKRR